MTGISSGKCQSGFAVMDEIDLLVFGIGECVFPRAAKALVSANVDRTGSRHEAPR